MSTQTVRRTISQKGELIHDVHEFGVNWDTREVYLHPYLGRDDSDEIDNRMAQQFVKNLTFLSHLNKNLSPILIHMITIGGEVLHGMAIYDAIRACRCPVSILAYAGACSMSSIILQAADYRVLMPNTEFMIHMGRISLEDTTRGFLSAAEQEKNSLNTMLDIYVNKLKHGEKWKDRTDAYIRKQLQTKMDSKQEWYLNAREAVEYGFADAVLGDDGYENIPSLLKEE